MITPATSSPRIVGSCQRTSSSANRRAATKMIRKRPTLIKVSATSS